MKCYYDVLEIPRDADDSQIKTAYRKLALKWHPDKNIDNTEEAKEQFQLVQQAYEVLSDRQERAWYDNHREQILRGSNKDFKDDSLDVFQYFTTSCFRGYGDDEKGFYTVYRKVFENIASEDIEHMDSKSDFDEIPVFGISTSDYDDIVGPFYAYWSSYNTRKSYVWLDPYSINEARNGRELKLIEKENKKVRQKAKKERNEEIRSLVAFVRKRDKRVQAHAKLLEAKVTENRLKQEQLRKQKLLQNKKDLSTHKSAEWSKFDNVKEQLAEIEKNLAEQFGESLSEAESNSDLEEDSVNDLYCVACNKVFKTPKAFANHESSKKHRENIEALKESMLEEEQLSEENSLSDHSDDEISDLYCVVCDKEFKSPKAFSNHETSKKHLENVENLKEKNKSNGNEENEEENSDLGDLIEDTIETIKTESKKKNKKSKKVLRTQKLSMTESELSENDISKPVLTISDDDFNFGSTKKQKKKNKSKNDTIQENVTINQEKTELNGTQENLNPVKVESDTTNKKRAKKSQKKNPVTSSDLIDIDLTHCCVTCKSNFNSKNKLFEHLKKTGHSIALPDKLPKQKSKKQSKYEK